MTPPSHDTCAAFVGSDWADAQHAGGLQAAGSATREGGEFAPPLRPSTRGAPRCVRGVTANPWLSASPATTARWAAPCVSRTCSSSARSIR
jgi:hypothetical protein